IRRHVRKPEREEHEVVALLRFELEDVGPDEARFRRFRSGDGDGFVRRVDGSYRGSGADEALGPPAGSGGELEDVTERRLGKECGLYLAHLVTPMLVPLFAEVVHTAALVPLVVLRRALPVVLDLLGEDVVSQSLL